MSQRLPSGYVFDPADPRATTLEHWERTQSRRERQLAEAHAEIEQSKKGTA